MMLIDTRANAVVINAGIGDLLNNAYTFVGTIPGVNITFVAAGNGPGIGRLRSESDGVTMRWTPPGETIEGPPVLGDVDGEYLVESPDPRKWIRINITAAFLLPNAAESRVHLSPNLGRFANFADNDITAAQASSGDLQTYTVTAENESVKDIFGLRIWLDPLPRSPFLNIDDGIGGWLNPRSEAAARVLGDIAPGANVSFLIRRLVAPSQPFDPKVVNDARFSFRTW